MATALSQFVQILLKQESSNLISSIEFKSIKPTINLNNVQFHKKFNIKKVSVIS